MGLLRKWEHFAFAKRVRDKCGEEGKEASI